MNALDDALFTATSLRKSTLLNSQLSHLIVTFFLLNL